MKKSAWAFAPHRVSWHAGHGVFFWLQDAGCQLSRTMWLDAEQPTSSWGVLGKCCRCLSAGNHGSMYHRPLMGTSSSVLRPTVSACAFPLKQSWRTQQRGTPAHPTRLETVPIILHGRTFIDAFEHKHAQTPSPLTCGTQTNGTNQQDRVAEMRGLHHAQPGQTNESLPQ